MLRKQIGIRKKKKMRTNHACEPNNWTNHSRRYHCKRNQALWWEELGGGEATQLAGGGIKAQLTMAVEPKDEVRSMDGFPFFFIWV